MTNKTLKHKMFVIPNDDEHFHEECDHEDLGNFPHPFRLILAGPCNVGKTNLIYIVLLKKKPMFERILNFHNDENAKEYQNVDAEYIEELLPIQEIDINTHNVIIIEDIDYKNMKNGKQQQSLLDKYFGYFSTHHNISVILTAQDPFQIPPNIRQMSSHVVLWKNHEFKQYDNTFKSF